VAQSLLEGFGEGLLESVSHLSVEKIEKHGQSEPKVFKVGDKVQLNSTIKIKANIYSDDGYHFIGIPSDISEEVTEVEASIDVEAGSIGFVNSVNGNVIEIIDLDRPVTKFAEIGIDYVNVDLITVDAEQLEKIDSDEVK
jgi:hypothetical protein